MSRQDGEKETNVDKGKLGWGAGEQGRARVLMFASGKKGTQMAGKPLLLNLSLLATDKQ